MFLRDVCVVASAKRLRGNYDRPPRPPSPVVIIDEPRKSDGDGTMASSVDSDESLMRELLFLMKVEDDGDVFVDAAEDAYEKSNGVSDIRAQRDLDDDDSESSFSMRYHLPAWPSPCDAPTSPLSTLSTASTAAGSLHLSMSGHTCVPNIPPLQNAFTPIPGASQTPVVTTFEPKSRNARGEKAGLAVKEKKTLKTGTRPQLRDLMTETRSREEIFEKGVPWGFHGRDYLPPLPKKHCLRETVRNLPREPMKKSRLFQTR